MPLPAESLQDSTSFPATQPAASGRTSASGESAPRLQVLIVAYGKRGIESVATLEHPRVSGVEYIVSWQLGGADVEDIPLSLREREDFRILPSDTRGVARNRNLALAAASAPLALESDDDVSYTAEQLLSVIQAFDLRPECDFISFRYHSSKFPASYPQHEADLSHAPKGYFIAGAFEMAFRLKSIRDKNIRFNEDFGIGSRFPAGEEDLFLNDVLKNGLTARFVPLTIVTHESSTTCMREGANDDFIRTKGAVSAIIHPHTWQLRMLTHAHREARGGIAGFIRYCRMWLRGGREVRKPLNFRR